MGTPTEELEQRRSIFRKNLPMWATFVLAPSFIDTGGAANRVVCARTPRIRAMAAG